MKDINNKLKEIGDHFVEKLLNGEFEFIKCDQYTAEIKIDGFQFYMWISNDPKDNFRFYNGGFSIFSENDISKIFDLKTQKNRLKAWRHIKPDVEKYRNTVLKKEKEKQLNRLKKELSQL